MTAAIGHPTLRLIRIAIGKLQLGKLQPGEWRELSPPECARLLRL
jgi:23S rRNA pseudouridine2457 synthase